MAKFALAHSGPCRAAAWQHRRNTAMNSWMCLRRMEHFTASCFGDGSGKGSGKLSSSEGCELLASAASFISCVVWFRLCTTCRL